jgi:hypothetical protein
MLVKEFEACLFLLGSRARCEEGKNSDVEFGIILPESSNVTEFKMKMCRKCEFKKIIQPILLDNSHHPWETYLETV